MMKDDMCDRVDCSSTATKKPVVHLRSSPMMSSEEVVIGVKVCDEHATQKDADDLINDAPTKATMQTIFRAQRGEEVDWSCSGVVWTSIN